MKINIDFFHGFVVYRYNLTITIIFPPAFNVTIIFSSTNQIMNIYITILKLLEVNNLVECLTFLHGHLPTNNCWYSIYSINIIFLIVPVPRQMTLLYDSL